jgi:CNT family concentrative nucleoside transporter
MGAIDQFRGLLGIAVFLIICWLCSTNRRRIQWRVVLWGIGLQFALAYLVLLTAAGRAFFAGVNDLFLALISFTNQGAGFVFGNLIWSNVPVGTGPALADGPFTATAQMVANTGAVFAFKVLPTIIFFASLMAVLYYVGFMQMIVKAFAWIMFRTMGTSGAETLSASANIFVGQTEAPLIVRPFVPTMTRSELMAIMTGGLATIAGGVMIAYITFLHTAIPNIAGHLLAASIMSAPAALVCAKLMVPEDETPVTMGTLRVKVEKIDVNAIDAAARGASEGLNLALNVAAMLIAFLALVAMADAVLGLFGRWALHMGVAQGSAPLSLRMIFGYVFWPIAWVMGVSAKDCMEIGNLLGLRTVTNEFVAYLQLSDPSNYLPLDMRSRIIATYAFCGFANIGSIGILLGGIGPLAPERRHDLARLGIRALIAGTFASFLTASIAGMFLTESQLLPGETTAVTATTSVSPTGGEASPEPFTAPTEDSL